MEISLQKSLEKAWTVISAALWAAVGGGVTTIMTALDDASVYEGPPDWQRLRNIFITGALVGAGMWFSKERERQKALYTPVPATPESDAAALKRSAEAAQAAAQAAEAAKVVTAQPEASLTKTVTVEEKVEITPPAPALKD